MSSPRVVLVSGGNTGIGLASVRSLLASTSQTYTVVLGSRSVEKGEAAKASLLETSSSDKITPDHIHVVQLDIEDEASVSKAFTAVSEKYGKLDVLINNAGEAPLYPIAQPWSDCQCDVLRLTAGASFESVLDQPKEDGSGKWTAKDIWTRSYNLNVVSTHFLTETFVPLLLKSDEPRILFISTSISSLTHQGAGPYPVDLSPPAGWPKAPHFHVPAYRSSKIGGNFMAKEWARELKEDKVVVQVLGLGSFATDFGGMPAAEKVKRGMPDPKEAGEFIRAVAEGERDADIGQLLLIDGTSPW
jgi:NAD(P)-dependent dehydrogenase (short-subunit alcohol dehydrogenase family)